MSYAYNKLDNLTEVWYHNSGSDYQAYTYIDSGQLARPDNLLINQSTIYTYDAIGNILTKKIYTIATADSSPSSLIFSSLKIQPVLRYYLERKPSGMTIRIWIDSVEKVIKTAFYGNMYWRIN